MVINKLATDFSIFDSLKKELENTSVLTTHNADSPASVRKMITAYREILFKYREIIRNSIVRESSGIELCRIITGVMDCFILHIAGKLGIDTGRGIALVALGGYGRCELNPFSDIDILFLVETEDSQWNEIIEEAIRFLIDLNLDLGHSTRTVDNCITESYGDSDLATSFLEARFIAGDRRLYDDFAREYSASLSNKRAYKLAMLKIDERNRRLAQYGGAVQVRVPNVKESPGALRDIHIIRWLTSLLALSGNFCKSSDSGLVIEKERENLTNDFDFLLKVRTELHFSIDKKNDLLDLTSLPVLAKNLGYSGQGRQAVENFMRDYYMRAGRIFSVADNAVRRYLDCFGNEKSENYITTPSGFILLNNRVSFPYFAENSLEKNPGLILKIFTFAGTEGYDLSESALSLIEKALYILGDKFPLLEEVHIEFQSFLNGNSGFGSTFRLMHKHGFLEKLIPEFGGISWHYQYDFYHAFTTDEHSLRTVEFLEKIAEGKLNGVLELTEMMKDVTAHGALMLAGLLHDMGKAGGHGHSIRGERLAAKALERLGCDERTIDTVRFLIREHLVMSHISQRRDMDDPEIIEDFARLVVDTMRLRMLTLITFADLLSLSDDAMTEWKKALLLRLYNKGFDYLEKGFDERTGSSAEKFIQRVVDISINIFPSEKVREHLEKLPEHYLFVTSPTDIRDHLKGIELMRKRGVWTSFRRQNGFTTLTVITRDYQRALSDICGTMTSSDINIVGAQIFTRSDGIIIDSFIVVNEEGSSLITTGKQHEFKSSLKAVVSGKADVPALIRDHINRWKRRRRKAIFSSPRIQVHNDISSRYTVMDVFATDYTGLLYDITSVMASFDLDIYTARIGTDEDQVADAFYLGHRNGGKIEDENELKKITSAIIDTLTRAY